VCHLHLGLHMMIESFQQVLLPYSGNKVFKLIICMHVYISDFHLVFGTENLVGNQKDGKPHAILLIRFAGLPIVRLYYLQAVI
jgi:hypothetical protein